MKRWWRLSALSSPGCLFCEIASGNRPARIIVENHRSLAFLDAFPLSEGHVLVIPRAHAAKIQDLSWNDAQAVFELVWKLSGAVESATGTQGSTIAVHNGKIAGQEIPHVHFHVIPRRPDDDAGPVHTMFKKRPRLSSENLDSISSRISLLVESSNQ